MHQNKELHQYLHCRTRQLTEEWYNAIEKSSVTGVYASDDPEVINLLKEQNFSFHEHLIKVFVQNEETFFNDFEAWVEEIASDSAHQSTAVHIILNEFFKVQEQYLHIIEDFSNEHEGKYTKEEIYSWNYIILRVFRKVMTRYVELHEKVATSRLNSQQDLINELSAPVIKLHQGIGLLPLIGEIDTTRANYLLENTLMECGKKGINHLFIDISGVKMIDTLVAMQIFRLIDALKIVGVKTTLSGVRPEIALTAVHLGVEFKDIHITGNLSQALQLK